ncbi:stage II sporulation protein M [Anaerophilus nitritogenes]|uniref:stage II sporulation protein M n=1 Tax=Anaerophilus nitritogenes TaxID=2498136 RepID=UPI00101D7C21|nr:stage II sporulation protein M [Anaerophilus nitritogenes]
MLKRFNNIVLKHIQGNAMIYFLVCMFFIIGISSGAFTVKALTDLQKQELIQYMKSFFQILNKDSIESLAILNQSLSNNLQTVILIWILGVTVIGMPLILILVGIRGLIIGFTVGFFIEQLGWKGMVFALASVLPQNLFIIPSIITIGVIAISFSKMLLRLKFNKSHSLHNNTFKQFVLYSTINGAIFIVVILGCVIEAYITPIFMKVIAGYM